MSDSPLAPDTTGLPDDATDQFANQLIDREVLDLHHGTQNTERAPGETDATATATLGREAKRRVADLLLLDALLAQGQSERKQAVERSLEAAMRRIRSGDAPQPAATSNRTRPSGRRKLWLWSSSLVAVALLALVAWHYDPSRQAHAMVDRITGQVLAATDRTYRVSIESNLPFTPRREARFYVRGGRRFVFDDPGPLGVRLLFGSDGSRRWQMTPAGPVLLPFNSPSSEHTSAPGRERELAQLPHDAPYLQLETLLARLRDRYRLTVGNRETLTPDGPRYDRLSARRIDDFPASFVWPETVDVWAASATGVVQRMELRWSSGTMPAGPRTLVFELESELPLGEAFFSAESHRNER